MATAANTTTTTTATTTIAAPTLVGSISSEDVPSTPTLNDENFDEFNVSYSVYVHPTLSEYYTNLTPFVTLSIFVSILILMLNISIFLTTIAKLKQRLRKPLIGPSIALISLYPLISLAALLTLLLPKIWFSCHTVMHLSFTVGGIIFYQLCLHYIGSEVSFIKETAGMAVPIRTPPLCCCCMCLPGVTPTKGRFVILRCMVYQMVFVQGSIMLVLNGIYYNDVDFFHEVQSYFLPFIISSIILGVWGLNITVRVVNNIHADYSTTKKMFSLQLILLLCKMQYLILDKQLDRLLLGGEYPMNHTIYKQTIINFLVLVEMVFVSLFAQHAYKIPIQIDDN
ncbi:organic solute transporter alpha-like protein [Anastrepha obliqua]|uniref:organic solute transporter alpha-like protein n=1 Tax=Anastrepha obliqua TaxID=95512 RepID=UPI00240A5554|nr:organic solute transporter alpha-like protein [Anastrepha obliqua]XP_054734859.1 organic solute transporter alpha-like protein [Anastrepha obliqua]